jgi:Protein of unknown function (DUF3303)
MLFMTTYRLRPHVKRAEVKKLMDTFAKLGAAPGEVANYARADGSGGWNIFDVDDLDAAYSYVLEFTDFFEFEITPVLKIEDAVGPILKFVGAD